MDTPRFTVVTPSFNQGAFIEKTIDSVLSQGYPDLEYIIIDGGSKDNTVEVIKKYERHLAYWVSEPDRGQSHAINKGMARATGTYLGWLNSDDRLMPGALAEFAAASQQFPAADLFVGVGEMVDINNTVTETYKPAPHITKDILLQWFSGTWFLQPACIFSRAVWKQCGPLDENQHFVFDIDFYLKSSLAGFHFHSMNCLVAQALRHQEAKTSANAWQTMLEGAILVERYGANGAVTKQCNRLIEELKSVTTQLAWYRTNYHAAASHPLVRMIQPLAKLFARSDSQYWRNSPPPWMP